MKDLFNCEYTEEIDVFKVSGEIQLAVPHKFRIIGVIYLAMRSHSENPAFCGIDLSTKGGKHVIKNAIRKIFA